MCLEVFEIVQQMNLSKMETRLALQCAPVIVGIKVSNLLTVTNEDEEQINTILHGTGIEKYCLFQKEKKSIYLLFCFVELVEYLHNPNVKEVLMQFGYRDLSLAAILKRLQSRYELYMQEGKDFPHELGVLLGYPREDVEGFIKHKGKKYLYAGYWKVYGDVEEKKLLFEAYESAKEGMIMLIANGYKLPLIIRYFQKYGWSSFLIDEDALG